MGVARPRIFFDTNVCGKLTSSYKKHALPFMAEVRKRYRIAVAPTTVFELLRSFKPGTAAYFHQDQAKFRACICGDDFPRYMELPVDFAMRRILGIPNANIDESRQYVKAILKAGSQAEVFKVFNPQKLATVFGEGVSQYAWWLENAKSHQHPFPSPEEWGVRWWSNYEGFKGPISEEQGASLGKGLTALYAYQKATFEKAQANPNLKVEKRLGDRVDLQQLVYLLEPDMHFLTDDKDIKIRASASEQSQRILMLSELMTTFGFL